MLQIFLMFDLVSSRWLQCIDCFVSLSVGSLCVYYLTCYYNVYTLDGRLVISRHTSLTEYWDQTGATATGI